MTTLRTYDRNDDQVIAPTMRTRWRRPKLAPGTFVEDMSASQGGRGFGMVVGITPEEVAVLWSVEPATNRSMDIKFNPLAVSEDIFIPVRTPKEEAEKFIAAGRARPDPENDAWVLKQLKRMAGIRP